MGYGDQPPPQQQPQQGQGQLAQGQGQYPDDYYVPYDPYMGKPSNDQALQVRGALYDAVTALHKEEGSFEEWETSMLLALTRASRIPGIDSKSYNRIVRKFKFAVVRAHSEGKTKILRSKMENLVFELELLVSRADMPMAGISGITAMVTNQSSQKQSVTMSQQQPKSPGFWPWQWKW